MLYSKSNHGTKIKDALLKISIKEMGCLKLYSNNLNIIIELKKEPSK